MFPAALWGPSTRRAGDAPTPVLRRDDALSPGGLGDDGPQLLHRDGDRALVRFRHTARTASAVALQANGWWHPVPSEACELRPGADGRWDGVFEVPADWRASYGFAVHHGPAEPPWRTTGMRAPGAEVVPDPGNPRRHRAGHGGATRSIIALPDDAPFAPATAAGTGPDPGALPFTALPDGPRTRWWASRPGDPGCEGLDPGAALPLLVLTDGEQHVDHLGTPALLARGVACGALPPMTAVFLDSGPRRSEVLGVPGGHARWIAEQLLPALRTHGLGTGPERVRVTTAAVRTVVAGSSFGGLTALFAGARAPLLIGAVIAQSVSLWRYPRGALVPPLLRAAAQPLRLRLQVGRYEGEMAERSRELHDALAAGAARCGSSLDLSLTTHSGGHDWAWWQPLLLRELSSLLR